VVRTLRGARGEDHSPKGGIGEILGCA
jgi:hypothetical protein